MTKMDVLFILIMMANLFCHGFSINVSTDLAEFVRCNADSFVNVVPVMLNNKTRKNDHLQLSMDLVSDLTKTHGLRARIIGLTTGDFEDQTVTNGYPGAPPMIPVEDFTIFILPKSHGNTNEFHEMVKQTFVQISLFTRVRRALVMLPGTAESFLETIREVKEEEDLSSHFFFAEFDASSMFGWHQVLTIRGQPDVVVNKLEFREDLCIHESYNLQNLTVTSVSLTWAPYLTIEMCDEEGLNCLQNKGALIDLAGFLGRMFNMTVVSTRDANGDWGVYPKNGSHDFTGDWGGVMGKVVLGEFATSLSEWRYFIERNELLDFVTTSSDYLFLALTPQPAPVDLGVFTRPFKKNAWICIFVTIVVMLVFTLLPYILFPKYFESTQAYRIVHVVSMLFFVLLNSFYGGAMTMFFTSEISMPFETLRDVMRDNSWKLVVQHGNQVNYQFQRDAGDEDYIKLWARMDNDPDNTIFHSVGEGLAFLREDRNVMHVFRGMLQGFFRDNPFHQQRLHTFGNERAQYQALIFTKNSPLTPVFKLGTMKLRENSVLGQIYSIWEGREISSGSGDNNASKTVLSAGQVIMVFIVMVFSLILSLLILLFECFWTQYENSKEIIQTREAIQYRKPKAAWRKRRRRIDRIKDALVKTGDLLVTDVQFN